MAEDEEHTVHLVQLCEISGLDEEGARALLIATDWDLEQAVSLHFAGLEDGGTAPAGGLRPDDDDDSAVAVELASAASEDQAAAEVAVEPVTPTQNAGWFSSVTGAISRFSQAVLGISSEEFEAWFLGRYGSPAPPFCKLCFGEACKEALEGNRLVLLWLHQDESPATDALCKMVLQSETVLPLLCDSYVFWAGDVCRFEPGQIARLLDVSNYPALVVCQPLRSGYDSQPFAIEWPLGNFAQPILRIVPPEDGAPLDADHIVACLVTASADFQEAKEARERAAEARRLRIAQERMLREEQDREYEEALLMDQMNAIRKQEEEEARSRSGSPQKERGTEASASPQVRPGGPTARSRNCDDAGEASSAPEAASALAAAAAKAAAEAAAETKRREQAAEERRVARGAEILAQPEPAPAGSATAKIQLRLPSGESIRRVFKAEQTLDEVYEWAHCCRPRPKPRYFDLRTSFPVKTLTDRSTTIGELGLAPSAALLLREREESDAS